MTVFENVAFGLRARRQTDGLKERVERALAAVQLEDFAGRYPHQLSGGQQQRVAFARAIVIEPSCILFDEPLSALDALLREEMRYELKRLVSERNITSVFVTHDQTEAMSMSDKIAVLNAGVVDQYDAPEEIYAHPQTQFVAHFVGKSNWLNETQLFRPENSSEEKKQGCRGFYLPVESVQYLGDSYEIFLRYDVENMESRTWMIHSSRKATPGELYCVYVDPEKIVTVKEG